MNLTVVIVSYKSSHLLDELILDIPKNFEIIIIENSLDTNLKKLEKKYDNVEVVFPNKNLGFSKALNLGLSKSKNNFVWCLCPDVKISTKCYNEIFNLLSHFDDFSLISIAAFLGIVPFIESFSATKHSISRHIENLFSRDHIFSIFLREYLGIIIVLYYI